MQLERLLDGLAKDGVRVMLWRRSRGRGWKVVDAFFTPHFYPFSRWWRWERTTMTLSYQRGGK